jgi:hypothetical protein
MDRWDEKGFEDGTEGERSPSGVPSSNPRSDARGEGDEGERGWAGPPLDPAAPPQGGRAGGYEEEPEDLERLDDERDADLVMAAPEDGSEGDALPLPPRCGIRSSAAGIR